MDNNEFGNKINPPSQGDYLPPEQEPAFSENTTSQSTPVMKFDPETGRPLSQSVSQSTPPPTPTPASPQTYRQESGYSQSYSYNYNNQQSTMHNNGNMYATAPKQGGTGFGVASLVLGIVSIVLCCTCVQFITGPLSIIFGAVHLAGNKPQKGLAIAGIICSIVAIVMGAFYVSGTSSGSETFWEEFEREFDRQYNSNDGWEDELESELESMIIKDFEEL